MVRPVSTSIKDFLRNLSWSGTAIVLSLGADFGFYILTGRLLGPEQFGIFGVFMALYYLSIGPISHAIEITAKKIAAEKESNVFALLKPTLKGGLIFWILFLLSSPVLGAMFSLPMKALFLFSLVFPFAYFLATLVGAAQGVEDFRAYAYYEFLSSAAKFSSLGLIALGFGIFGAVTAPVMEVFAGLFVILIMLKPQIPSIDFDDYKLLKKSSIFILAVYAAFSVDILAFKLFMSTETVGLYNAVATMGKAVFFGSVAINRAVFPKFVKNPDKRFYLLHFALLLILAGGIFSYIFFSIYGATFIALTFGSAYAAAAKFAPLYMIFITVVSSISLIGNYLMASDKSFNKILLLPLIEVIGIYLFHSTVSQSLYALTGAAILIFFTLYLPILIDRTRSN